MDHWNGSYILNMFKNNAEGRVHVEDEKYT